MYIGRILLIQLLGCHSEINACLTPRLGLNNDDNDDDDDDGVIASDTNNSISQSINQFI